MSGAKLLDFGAVTEFGNLDFPNLERRLERRLAAIKTLPDLEKLIKLMNPLLKAERYNMEEQTSLRRLRQRAYDRRRNPKFQIPKSVAAFETESKIQIERSAEAIAQKENVPNPVISEEAFKTLPTTGVVMPIAITEKAALPEPKMESFSDGVLRAFSSIDGELFVKAAPKLLAWFIAAALVSFFLWQQSLALYETAGFTNSIYSAAGGILMIVGFAAYHSITRSWLALFFCLYAGAYEGYLMVSGTIHNENQTQAGAVQNNPDLVFLQEKADKEHARYQELKQRYDNPESKVFQNDWFLKTQLNPAWDTSAKAHEELITKKVALIAAASVEHVTWLKILYRLGLVFLCMILVHRLFTCLATNKAN